MIFLFNSSRFDFSFDSPLFIRFVAFSLRFFLFFFFNLASETVMAGCKPAIDCYTILLTVFSRVGLPDDVQRFYESQVRTGLNFDREFHEVMFYDFLKRGYYYFCFNSPVFSAHFLRFPKSAHHIASTKMKADGFDLSREQLLSLIEKYAEMGGGSQALTIFENDYIKYVKDYERNFSFSLESANH